MLQQLRVAVVMLLSFTVLTGVVYPLAVSGVAWVMMQDQALGSLVRKDGKVIGSSLVGQSFTSERYFHPRPSATSGADPSDPSKTVDAPYNAAASTGSNLGPITKKLIDRVQGSVDELRKEGVDGPVPVDAVTTSSSGLDPDISPQNALMQVPRVAKARGLPEERLRRLVNGEVEGRALGVLGEPKVNVLRLNLALDSLGAP
ncbi:K(+) transporting P-type ATPase subunit KdpC [Hyphomicrobium sp. 1Nfss2.1]|uniref:potassium-transporting ATPase subunit KdpC n=1 Tax=Hyphomicrobium sp. 1Nfss2.1 TaxID=3413936 RepID=UPI003C79CDEB